MKKYSIVYSQEANDDINALYYFIVNEYKTYQTADKYVQGLENTIKQLIFNAETFQVQTNRCLAKYGTSIRRVNYRKMAVIYTVEDSVVLIKRVMPQSLITD